MGMHETFQPGEIYLDDMHVTNITTAVNEEEWHFTFLDPEGNEVVKILKYGLNMPQE